MLDQGHDKLEVPHTCILKITLQNMGLKDEYKKGI